MNEELIHYLWKYRLFDHNSKTDRGEDLVVISPGEHNRNSGPDFLNAMIKVGETTWAGNVEMHVKASDWYRHEHSTDPAYANVILHVVAVNDADIADPSGQALPTFSILNYADPSIVERYDQFLTSRNIIPCQSMIGDIDDFQFNSWAPALAVERLRDKYLRFLESWEASGQDWEEFFYRQLARAFGFRINGDVFEDLAKSLPLRIMRRHLNSVFQMEALFYGQAGILEAVEDYPSALLREYNYLKEKYRLVPLQPGLLRFLRLRPSNFPTLRISQLCNLLHKSNDIFSKCLSTENPADLYSLFTTQASSYWDNHFVFGRLSSPSPKKPCETSYRLLILNLVVPFLFFYGDMKKITAFRERALAILESEPPEANEIISFWKSVGIKPETSLHSQALLQLKIEYCSRKKCLECRIGIKLLQ